MSPRSVGGGGGKSGGGGNSRSKSRSCRWVALASFSDGIVYSASASDACDASTARFLTSSTQVLINEDGNSRKNKDN